jgi:hypothetical protein
MAAKLKIEKGGMKFKKKIFSAPSCIQDGCHYKK